MKRNYLLKKHWLTALLLGTIFLGTTSCTQKEAPTQKPNVIVILTDDMGYSDIGCFGSEINTPNIDHLAATGLRFTQFYNTARCSPTRASLLTGLYPHQAEMGQLAFNQYEEEGYRDDLSKNALTLAELFKANGYSTFMTGKWHVCYDVEPDGDKSNWPLQRGFDRHFGTITGSGSFYNPSGLVSGNNYISPGNDFYYTEAISDTTVKYINQHPGNQPFFCYVAYTAAHWPLHAPEEEIAKYKGTYDKGWDETRKERFAKLKKLGIIDDRCVLTERGVDIPEWKDEEMKEWQARRMEVYAAMVDVMDQGIGKIITALENRGMLENTIIFYMHDNGGCAEAQGENKSAVPLTEEQKILRPYAEDSILYGRKPQYARDGRFVRRGRGVMPGPADTWVAYGEEWANVSNTPFRMYKHWVHEGGISTPMIVHWPGGIKAANELRNQPSHLIDIMATCIDVANLDYPKQYNGHEIQPYEGKSLAPAFENKPVERDYIIWEHEGNRAIRAGNWKLVSKVRKLKKFTPEDENAWELYDMENDRSETVDLAEKYPEKVKELAELWEKEAVRTKIKPWPWNK
ncbi:arylsulfatase [Maribellus sp. CM-23]|uniref:arylsulfatase n=1 Tax=Maribellus sp. CM-23 TaxID=2781026 RepID=UPI001F16D87B|nr:arylsulfatase [Maribellus sp. CM-23]